LVINLWWNPVSSIDVPPCSISSVTFIPHRANKD
jgi:hypothetical protein